MYLWVEVFISFFKDQVIFVEGLNGFHRIVFIEFIDVVCDAGVEGNCRNWMDNSGIMGLPLISLTVSIYE